MPRRPNRGRSNRGAGGGSNAPPTAPVVVWSDTTPGVTGFAGGSAVTHDATFSLASGSAITTQAIGTITLSGGSGWCTAAFVSGAVRLTVNPAALTAGNDYTATVPVTLGNVAGSSTTNLVLTFVVVAGAVIGIGPTQHADYAATAGQNQTNTEQAFTIANAGQVGQLAGPTFSGVTYSAGPFGWATVTGPVAVGDGTYTFTVNADTNGLVAGSHAATFTIADTAATNTPQTFTINAVVTAPAPTPTMSLDDTTAFFTAVENSGTTATDQILVSNSGSGTLAAITASKLGGASWLTVTVTGGANAQQINLAADVTGLADGTYTETVRLTSPGATNNPQDIAVIFDVTPEATAPVLAVSPSSLSFATVEGGANPISKTFTATNVGTGVLAGPTAVEAASWLTVTRTGSGPWTFTCAVNNAGLLAASSPYTANITVSDTANTGTDQTVTITVTVASAPVGTYPNLPYALPVGMTFNVNTNLPEGTPLQIKYADTPQTTLVNMEVTADSLGRTLGSNATTNAAILQRWLNDDATAGIRRGYTFNAGRQFLGALVTPHNAGAGWTLLKPNGYTYDPTLEVPPTYADPTRATFTATGANQPAIRTSLSGAADSNHGRLAIMGVHLTHDNTTGDTFLNVLAWGVVCIGSTNENTAAKKPLGICLHDCSIGGLPGRYLGRGMWGDGGDIELRAVRFDEIHRSWTNATDTGQIQDVQCLLIETGWRVDCRFTVFHGGDEPVNIGGGASKIANYGPMHDFFFGWCEFSHNDRYLFNDSGTDGPYNKQPTDRWHAKNCFEAKTGIRGLAAFCRFSGLTEPNNNQGYALAMKSAVYGTNNPTQTVADWHFHGCWIDRAPAGLGMNAFESIPAGGLGLPAARIYMGDTFCWKLNSVVGGRDHAQIGKRPLWAQNGSTHALDGIFIRHVSNFTESGAQDGALFSYDNNAPNCITRDSFTPWLGQAIMSNDNVVTTRVGTAALNAMAPGPTWTWTYNTIVPKTGGYPSNYPQGMNNTAVTDLTTLGVVDFLNGDLRLSPASSYYAGGANDASDGWNRGVADPDMVYTQLARTPTALDSHPTVP